jgi:hypothetical protein
MFSVTLDPKSLEQLRRIEERVEIRYEAGQLIGYFTPTDDRPLEVAQSGDVELPFTEEDLDRFEGEPGGRTLDEIQHDLEQRS